MYNNPTPTKTPSFFFQLVGPDGLLWKNQPNKKTNYRGHLKEVRVTGLSYVPDRPYVHRLRGRGKLRALGQ